MKNKNVIIRIDVMMRVYYIVLDQVEENVWYQVCDHVDQNVGDQTWNEVRNKVFQVCDNIVKK